MLESDLKLSYICIALFYSNSYICSTFLYHISTCNKILQQIFHLFYIFLNTLRLLNVLQQLEFCLKIILGKFSFFFLVLRKSNE